MRTALCTLPTGEPFVLSLNLVKTTKPLYFDTAVRLDRRHVVTEGNTVRGVAVDGRVPPVSIGFEVVWAHSRSVRCAEDGDLCSRRESNPGVKVAVLTALLLDRTDKVTCSYIRWAQ